MNHSENSESPHVVQLGQVRVMALPKDLDLTEGNKSPTDHSNPSHQEVSSPLSEAFDGDHLESNATFENTNVTTVHTDELVDETQFLVDVALDCPVRNPLKL
jgi:hypothetical protein